MRFAHGGRYLSGLVVPLSALRSEASPACGEFADLVALGELAKSWGLDLIQLLPVNDSGYQSSPYSALSAFALHPLYLRARDLPEAAAKAAAPILVALAELAAGHAHRERLAYGGYLDAKLALLERLFAASWPEGKLDADPGFAAWLAANPWVKAYAVFVERKRAEGGLPWWQWPVERDPSAARIEELWMEPALQAGTRFRAWLQWRAEAQFAAAAARLAELGVALMGDLPILLNEDSADVWSRRGIFKRGLSAGAPPDMYSQDGQNWGFPIYDWAALEREDYSFWRERLAAAAKFYSSYRIDHVLGFFRIWALGERERSGVLGRFVPDACMTAEELGDLGFGPERLRWLSRPHLPGAELRAAVGEEAAGRAIEAALVRIGSEDLFLFKDAIRGERDLEALGLASGAGLPRAAVERLVAAWRDRALFEFEPGRFVPSWTWRETRAYRSLSDGEREALESLAGRKRTEGDAAWEENGRRLLGMLRDSTSMLPCAEDLGAVPDCVPRVLEGLGIYGLRVLRWARRWEEEGSPFAPLSSYPRLSVACPSVHDSSSLREWWEGEAPKPLVWELAAKALGRPLGPVPGELEPESAEILLEALSASNSGIVVFPIQDLLSMSRRFRPESPQAERVNVPGVVDDWNWGYRLPAGLEEIARESALGARVLRIAAARPRGRP